MLSGQATSTSANSCQVFDKTLMTYDEAAAYISARWRKTAKRTLERWVALGRLKVTRPNGYNVAIERAAVDALLLGNNRRRKREKATKR